mmetsp:Transcript_19227/g.41788  ORF Transcript_19227/g.41788 Transcript_19227/m.41788 type:complete len:326 (-) Transcript_19227:311-1288(-)
MLDFGISRLVQGIGNPGGIETLVAAHPALFNFGQTLVGTVQDIRNGGNSHVLRYVEAINYLNFFFHTRFSDDTDHEGSTDGIDGGLGFFFRSHGNNDLQIDRSCGLGQLDGVCFAGQELPIQDNRTGTDCGRLSDLNLVDNHVAVDDGNGSGNLVAGTALFFDKFGQVSVVAPTHSFIGQHGDSRRTKFSEFAAQQVGLVGGEVLLVVSHGVVHLFIGAPVDVDVPVDAIGDLAFVFGNDRDGSLASRELFLKGTFFFWRSIAVVFLQCRLDYFVAFHDLVRNSIFFETFSQFGFLCLAHEAADSKEGSAAAATTGRCCREFGSR